MIEIKINNKLVEVAEGTMITKAARAVGIDIPTMCEYEGVDHFTSCMVCVVKDKSNNNLIPACSVRTTPDMDINTDDEEIHQARKSSLELLLSDHVGDCEAPCKLACPAHMDIPKMNRLLAEDKIEEALEVVYNNIALPSVLGRICHAPCENACHRKTIDEPVSICLLKRYAGDNGTQPKLNIPTNTNNKKKIAIIGSGPAGLSASFYLRLKGFNVSIFDKNTSPGGMLRVSISEDILPLDVLEREIKFIKDSGVIFKQNIEINAYIFNELRKDFDVIVFSTGSINDNLKDFGFEINETGIVVNKKTFETSLPGVFAIGNSIRTSKHAIRALGHGKELVTSVIQYVNNEEVTGSKKRFNSRFGKLIKEEFEEYLKESNDDRRYIPKEGLVKGFTKEEVINEASRCLHCDCRKLDNCKLRDYSDKYGANQKRYWYGNRNSVTKVDTHELIIYEPEKCIKCSICIRITEKQQEKLGLSFIGRGFDVKINVPYNNTIEEGLKTTSIEVAKACPTGAISLKIE